MEYPILFSIAVISGEEWMIRFMGWVCVCLSSRLLYTISPTLLGNHSILALSLTWHPHHISSSASLHSKCITMYFCLSQLFITYSLFRCPWLLLWATKSSQSLTIFHHYVSSEFRLQTFCEVLEIVSLVLDSQ